MDTSPLNCGGGKTEDRSDSEGRPSQADGIKVPDSNLSPDKSSRADPLCNTTQNSDCLPVLQRCRAQNCAVS